jgi:uncharacterized protein involved in outer membrane biogenesis
MRKGLVYGGTAVAAVVIIVVVVLFVALASVDSIVKAAIERVGSDVTQTEVTVDDVEISLTSGEGTIRGLVIGHPQGFEERMIRIGEARIVLDIGTLTSDTIVIKEIAVTAPQVTVEVSGEGTNVSRLQETLTQSAGGGGGGASGGNPEDEKKLVIERVTVADGRVDLKAAGLDRGVGADLPSITLTDIGKDSGGADPAEVAKVIVAAVSAAAGQAAITSGVLQQIEGGVGDKAKGLLEKGAGGLKGLIKK